ncbi:hypothetical protein VNO77_02922 [Canavalia gladiata]|uniref:Uncharacterized protein n=1 Tax=Canavalia gladiata TaxID=3824 RepID=A0AAN9R7P1_CANGL
MEIPLLMGASRNYIPCIGLAYKKAISDGVDILDCPVQMWKSVIPFCSNFVDLLSSDSGRVTLVAHAKILHTCTLTKERLRALAKDQPNEILKLAKFTGIPRLLCDHTELGAMDDLNKLKQKQCNQMQIELKRNHCMMDAKAGSSFVWRTCRFHCLILPHIKSDKTIMSVDSNTDSGSGEELAELLQPILRRKREFIRSDTIEFALCGSLFPLKSSVNDIVKIQEAINIAISKMHTDLRGVYESTSKVAAVSETCNSPT